VEAWDRHEQHVVSLDNATCAFGYRHSLFKRQPGRYIVTAVRFALPRQRELRLDYAGIREQLARMGIDQPAPYHVAEAVVHLRTRKLPDPAVIGNAGSFFKNPIVEAAVAESLRREHPELVAWPGTDGRCKLSAAWMIEAMPAFPIATRWCWSTTGTPAAANCGRWRRRSSPASRPNSAFGWSRNRWCSEARAPPSRLRHLPP
jgi:hypothetical protein